MENKVKKLLLSKTFLLFMGVLLLLSFLGPVSILKANKKIDLFLQSTAQSQVVKLQKELGIKIQWERLHFKMLDFSINLEGIVLEKASQRATKKTSTTLFLEGSQRIEKVFLRPSLFFLFKKRIFFSRIELQGGEFSLKTVQNLYRRKKQSRKRIQSSSLPFKKIVIKNTNVSLNHRQRNLYLSNVKWIVQNKSGQYDFTISVEKVFMAHEDPFSLQAKGYFSEHKFALNKLGLKNESVRIDVSRFSGSFNKNGLENLKLESRGQLPFETLTTALLFFGQSGIDYFGPVSYKLSLEKKSGKPFTGRFDIRSKEGLLRRDIPFKEFYLKGYFRRYLLVAENGFIKTTDGALLTIKKAELLVNKNILPFQVSLAMKSMPTQWIQKSLDFNELPLKATVTGRLKCKGRLALFEWDCQAQLHTPKLNVRADNTHLARFNDMNINLNIKQTGKSKIQGSLQFEKNTSTNLQADLVYLPDPDNFQMKLNGYTNLSRDTVFPAVSLKGNIAVRNGFLEIRRDQTKLKAQLQSDFLEVEGYKIKNIQSLASYKEDRLLFTKIKAGTDKSSYTGQALFDFKEERAKLNFQSSFFYTQELQHILKKKIPWPFQISGTGAGSFVTSYHFSDPLKNKLQLKGTLFNASLKKEFFPNISFHISSEGNKGKVHAIKLKKNVGEILLSGVFDNRFQGRLDITGSQLALERIQTLNDLLPFNQSGRMDFQMKAKGSLTDPLVTGEIKLSETALYTYPVKDSKLKVAINKKGLLLSGHIMEEIHLKRFHQPFKNTNAADLQGRLVNWDFVKVRLAHAEQESLGDRFSKLQGQFDLSIHKNRSYRGLMTVTHLQIQKNSRWIKNQKPFRLTLGQEEKPFLSDVRFEDHRGRILNIQNTAPGVLMTSGHVSLGFFSFLFPSLKELTGQATIQLKTLKKSNGFQREGHITITDGSLELKPLPAVRNIHCSIKVQNETMNFKNFTGFSGNGTVNGKGTLTYKGADLFDLNTHFHFKDITLNIPEDFSTTGSGDLHIKGKDSSYSLTGNYIIEKGLIKKEFSGQTENEKDLFSRYTFLKEGKKTKASPFYLEIQMKTLNPVLVKNTFIEAAIKGGSRIYGPLNDLALKGVFDIPVDTGRIFFRGQEFKISSGRISFEDVPPDNPFLKLNANTVFLEKTIDTTAGLKAQKETTREYDIFLTANGPAKDLTVKLSSFPPLSEKEIVSMLTLGVGSRYFDTKVKENITQYSYQLIGSLLLRQPLYREIRDRLGLELDIDNSINIQSEPVTKIVLKKKWLKSLQTSVSRTIEELPQHDAKLKYELNRNMALTAFWESNEPRELEETLNSRNRTGLDLELSFEF